jgi:hypothetical protein
MCGKGALKESAAKVKKRRALRRQERKQDGKGSKTSALHLKLKILIPTNRSSSLEFEFENGVSD